MSKRQEKSEKRRMEILFVALELFIKKGYGSTKVVDIIHEANISMGLLFHYFGSKEQLYHELIKIGYSSSNMNFNSKGSPLEILSNQAKNIMELISNDTFAAKMFVFMIQAFHNDGIPEQSKELLKQFSAIEQSVYVIEKGQRLNEIRSGSPRALAIAFWGAIQGIAQEIVLWPDSPCPKSEWIVDIIRKNAEEDDDEKA